MPKDRILEEIDKELDKILEPDINEVTFMKTCLSLDCPERTGGECNGEVSKELLQKVGQLRQWLNERPKDAPLLTNEDLLVWLSPQ